MTNDHRTQCAIHALWNEVADFEAAQADAARLYLLGRICELIGAHNATWVGAVRMDNPHPSDPLNGWRPRAVRRLRPNPQLDRESAARIEDMDAGSVDETTTRNVELSGQYRVNRLVELAPDGWFEGAFYRSFYLGVGHCDAIWAGIPVNEDAEVYFGFYRKVGQDMFDQTQRDIVAEVLRPLKWFHRLQMLCEGIGVASGPLSPAERRVLHSLLQGLTEKQIAAANSHSPHTTHEYVKRVFRKYGVTSRAQLMALWLGKAP